MNEFQDGINERMINLKKYESTSGDINGYLNE
jgi:hypothetical protein